MYKRQLLSNLQKNLDLSKLEEFTIEANPGDLTVDKIEVDVYKRQGQFRLSSVSVR